MKAAVVRKLGEPPRYEEFPDPVPADGEVLVEMTVAPVNNIDRMMAEGSHYDGPPEVPYIVGTIGAGVTEDGQRVLFGGLRAPYGALAERATVKEEYLFPIPNNVDDTTATVLPNPALSSLVALRSHGFQKGHNVLILGATGVAGSLAVQIAKHFGANRVTAVGRNAESLARLESFGADHAISLLADDEDVKRDFIAEVKNFPVDIILDFVWGRPAELLLDALTGDDVTTAASHPIKYVQIGEMAGPDIRLSAKTLRSRAIQLTGSGGGSVPQQYLQKIPEYFAECLDLAARGILTVETERVSLKNIESAWSRTNLHGKRLVVENSE